MKFHCLFEQSGTFKNMLKEFGHDAFDYDILNEYGETDHQIDLFHEIEIKYGLLTGTWNKGKTIFCDMKSETDFILAFFPCTYFTDLNEIVFKSMQNRSEPLITAHEIEKVLNRNKERSHFYEIFVKMCFICHELKIPTIIENPIGMFRRNYLTLYSPFLPKWFDRDRTKFGDKFIKPTMYIPINFDMKEEFIMFDKEYNTAQVSKLASSCKERSEITPRYARNFYKRFIEKAVAV